MEESEETISKGEVENEKPQKKERHSDRRESKRYNSLREKKSSTLRSRHEWAKIYLSKTKIF